MEHVVALVMLSPLWTAALAWISEIARLNLVPDGPKLDRSREGGWTVAASAAIAIGMAIYSAYLRKKLLKNLRSDEKPTALTLRGSQTSYLIGIDVLNPVFAWAGNRQTRDEKQHGKKGGLLGGGPKVKIFHEDGWHVVCPGVGRRLLAIKSGGKNIFTGPIDSTSHPSGTVVDLGREGMFAIYWGEELQPVNTFLGDASRVGVDSAWPWVVYIQWIQKRLGESPLWPDLSYEFDIPPDEDVCTAVGLTGDGYLAPTSSLSGNIFSVIAATNGVVGVGKLTVRGDRHADFKPGEAFLLTGNAHPDGNLVAYNVVVYQFQTAPPVDPDPDLGTPGSPAEYETRTDIYIATTLSGADATGTVESYTYSNDDGYNPAHIIAHALFAPVPLGLGRDMDLYDLDSLVEFEDRATAEGLRCRMKGEEGAAMEGLLQGFLLDCGLMLPIDPISGKLTFVPNRETSDPSTLPEITREMIIGPVKISRRTAGWRMDEAVINYKDRQQGYRDNPFLFTNDGIISWGGMANTRTLELVSTNLVGTAQVFAKRRAYEDLSPNTHFDITTKNETRLLIPGQVFKLEGKEMLIRLVEVKPDEKTDSTTLTCFADNYGSKPTSIDIDEFPGDDPALEALPDLVVQLVEVPEYLLGKEKPTTMVLRVRAHSQIKGATIYSSEDNNTYEAEDNDTNSFAGGELLDPIPVDGLYLVEEGPTFTILGPDFAGVRDLSGNEAAWRRGEQLMAIGTEIFYVRNFTILSPTTAQAMGVMRARYDTRPQAHAVGAELVIFPQDEGFALQKSYQVPDGEMFVKTTPFTSNVISDAAAAAHHIQFYGKGIRPIAPTRPRLTTIHSGYHTGEDLTFVWDYFCPRSPLAGAGYFPAGGVLDPISPEGGFLIRFYDNLDALVSEYPVEGTVNPSFDYPNAQLVADFGSEPTSFNVRVFQLRDGYRSFPSPVRTIEKIP